MSSGVGTCHSKKAQRIQPTEGSLSDRALVAVAALQQAIQAIVKQDSVPSSIQELVVLPAAATVAQQVLHLRRIAGSLMREVATPATVFLYEREADVLIETLFSPRACDIRHLVLRCLATLPYLARPQATIALRCRFHMFVEETIDPVGMSHGSIRDISAGDLHILMILLENSGPIRTDIESSSEQILRALLQHVETLTQGTEATLTGDTSTPQRTPGIMGRLKEAMKGIHELLERFPGLLRPTLASLVAELDDQKKREPSHAEDDRMELLRRLAGTMMGLLRDATLPRDISCSVARILVQLVLMAYECHPATVEQPEYWTWNEADADGAQTIMCCKDPVALAVRLAKAFFWDQETRSVLDWLTELNVVHEVKSLHLTGRMALARALVTTVSADVFAVDLAQDGSNLLLDWVIPIVCEVCESTADQYLRMVSFMGLDRCLAFVVEMLKGGTDLGQTTRARLCTDDAFVPELMRRVKDLVWMNWENSFVLQQIREVFARVVRIDQLWREGRVKKEAVTPFANSLIRCALELEWHRKGKYAALRTLIHEFGTAIILEVRPHFLDGLLLAMGRPFVAGAAGGLLGTFLECLLKEHQELAGEDSLEHWREVWVPPLVLALQNPNEKVAQGVATYALKVVVALDPEAVWILLHRLHVQLESEHLSTEETTACIRAQFIVLKWARSCALIDGSDLEKALDGKGTDEDGDDEDDEDDGVVQEGGSFSHTTGRLPQYCLKIDTLCVALVHVTDSVRLYALELLCASRKTTEPPTSLELRLLREYLPYNIKNTSSSFRKSFIDMLKRFLHRARESTIRLHTAAQKGVKEAERSEKEILGFCQWLADLAFSYLYPGSPFARKVVSLELIGMLIDSWGTAELLPLFTADNTALLLNCVQDAWDALRGMAEQLITRFPTPLPGLESPGTLLPVLRWSLCLSESPRLREAEAGALVLRTIFRKYAQEMGWFLTFAPPAIMGPSRPYGCRRSAVLFFLEGMLDFLDEKILLGKRDIVEACHHSLVHGLLLSIRFVMSQVDFGAPHIQENLKEWRTFVVRLLKQLEEVKQMTIRILYDVTTASCGDEEGGRDFHEGFFLGESEETTDLPEVHGGLIAPREQLLVVGSWLSLKEMVMLSAALVDCLPMASPGQDEENAVLPFSTVEAIAETLLDVLFTTRHNGVVQKASVAFTSLCQSLYTSPHERLRLLPSTLLTGLLHRLTTSTYSFLRRSGGFPFAFMAILLPEPTTPRLHLARVMKTLLDLVSDTTQSPNTELGKVHALNVLRSIFMESSLGVDVLPHVSEAMVAAITGFSSESWPIRNSSLLLYSALVRRSLGQQSSKMEVPVSGISGSEFFARHAHLHPFLLCTLNESTATLDSSHPRLFPTLILLSKLLPSESSFPTDPFLMDSFVVPIRQCSTHGSYMIRAVAARAIVPVLQSSHVVAYLGDLIRSLPTCPTEVDNCAKPRRMNAIHGSLLQVRELLTYYLFRSPQDDVKRDLICNVMPLLGEYMWLATAKNSCPLVRSSMFHVFSEILVERWKDVHLIAGGGDGEHSLREIREAIIALARDTLHNEEGSEAFTGVGASDLPSKATTLLLHATLGSDDTAAVQRELIVLLRHKDDDVHSAALKALNHWLKHTPHHPVLPPSVTVELFELLQSERNMQCLRRSLHVLWLLDARVPIPGTLSSLWKHLASIFCETRNSGLREHLLRFMGTLMKQMCQEVGIAMKPFLREWTSMLQRWSEAEALASVRMACIESVESSGILLWDRSLSPWDGEVEECVVRIWIVTLLLLQDEDEDIREVSSRCASTALARHNVQPFSLRELGVITLVPQRTIESVFAFLSESFGATSPLVRSFLLQQIEGGKEVDSVFNTDDELARRLFERESDNPFAEDIITAQLAVQYLPSLLHPQDSDDRAYATVQLQRFVEKLHTALTSLNAFEKNSEWIGGVTFHYDTFLCLYRLVLGVIAVSPLADDAVVIRAAQELETHSSASLHPLCRRVLGVATECLTSGTPCLDRVLFLGSPQRVTVRE